MQMFMNIDIERSPFVRANLIFDTIMFLVMIHNLPILLMDQAKEAKR